MIKKQKESIKANSAHIQFDGVEGGQMSMNIEGTGTGIRAALLSIISQITDETGETMVEYISEMLEVAELHEQIHSDDDQGSEIAILWALMKNSLLNGGK